MHIDYSNLIFVISTQILIFAPKIENNEIQICCIISPAPLLTLHCYTKLLQKSEMRKVIVIELSYKGFS